MSDTDKFQEILNELLTALQENEHRTLIGNLLDMAVAALAMTDPSLWKERYYAL